MEKYIEVTKILIAQIIAIVDDIFNRKQVLYNLSELNLEYNITVTTITQKKRVPSLH